MRANRSVRVDRQLLDDLEQLARDRLVPTTFSDQVHAGLRLLVADAQRRQVEAAAAVLAADRDRAEATFDRLHHPRP